MSTEITIAEQPQQLLTIEPKKYVELVFEPFAKQLEDAKVLAAKIEEFDVTTTAGMATAVKYRALFRDIRVSSEKARKERKAPVLEIGKLLDSRYKAIEAEIEPFESRFDKAIKAEEARKDAEREAKIQVELAHVAELQQRVAELRGNPALSAQNDSTLIAEHIGDLEKIQVDDSFQEFRQQAEDAKAAGLSRLREIHTAAVAREAEQERIRVEREELARLRAEQAERERKAAEEQVAERARITAQEQAAREEAERERQRHAADQLRIAGHRARLSASLARGAVPMTWTSEMLRAQLSAVEGGEVGDGWEEFQEDAEQARTGVIRVLQARIADAEKHEAEVATLAEQRAELERQQLEQAERGASARLAREAEERRIREVAAEVERQQKAAREAQEAEAARLESERQDLARREEELRKAQEPAPLVETSPAYSTVASIGPLVGNVGEITGSPTAEDLIQLIAEHYDVDPDTALEWLGGIAWHERSIAA